MVVNYLPYTQRTPDDQYQKLLNKIVETGEKVDSQQEAPATMIHGHQMTFDLSNGFPIITERDLCSADPGKRSQFEMAIGELCAFLNGAQTLEEMKAFGCGWWAPWVTKAKCEKRGLAEGDLGPGSYGAAFRRFPAFAEPSGSFDQWAEVLEEARANPKLRTLFVSPWIPQYIPRRPGRTQQVVVAPCHGWVHIHINPDLGTLSLHHFQRSADAPVGLVFNLIQYASLTMMLAQVLGYRADKLVYTTSDTHIYRRQMDDVLTLTSVRPQALPTVTFTEEGAQVTDLFAFRPHHFTVADYHPQNERMKIWTPV